MKNLNTKTKKPTRKAGKSTIALIAVFVVLVIAVGTAGGFAFKFYKDNLSPVNENATQEIIFTIEPGDTIKTLATRLEKDGIIRHAKVFELAARINNKLEVQAGSYAISASMDGGKILNILTDPAKAITNQVSVTLKEGQWSKDMAKAIAEVCDISAEALISTWNDEEFIEKLKTEYWFIGEETIKSGERIYLEGYLYPDTYYFFKDSSAETITYKLLDGFDEKITPLKSQIEANGMSLDEIVTLASIVQFESGNYQDMPVIAGVFFNRIKDDWKLESSVTICYVLYNYTDPLECELDKNRKIDSPYNTYMYKGLPLGPILNPTYQAINAVLNPTSTDYYFFIGINGVTYFAKTNDEHEANIKKYLR